MTFTLTIVGGKPKRDIIQMAREFCSLAGYEFGDTPEEEASHLRELDAMMAEEPWDLLGYDPATYGSGRPEDPSGIPNWALSAVSKYLGLRIAPGLAKSVTPEAKAALAISYSKLVSRLSVIPSMPRRNTPRGSGNSYWSTWRPFINEYYETPDAIVIEP